MSANSTTDKHAQPPLVPGLPLLGNASAMTKDLMAFIVEQYQRLGPIFRVRALHQEFVVMAGPEANIFVTQEGADKLSSRETWYKYGKEFGVADQMQDIDGELHLRMRKAFKHSYSASSLMSDIPLLVAIAQNVIDKFKSGEEVAALYLFRLIVTEQLGRALAGHAPGDDLDSIMTSIRVALNVHVTGQTPAIMLKHPSYQRAKRRYLRLGHRLIAEHRTKPPGERPDLIDTILAASQDNQLQEVLGNEAQLAYAALGPFVAGLDTVANECTFMLYALLEHPAILKQCVEEADHFFSAGLPEQAQLRSLGVLHYAMQETLRRYSIAPAITRNAAKTFEFAGYQVKAGQKIIIASTAAHFLPQLYPDPYTFDITRYSEPRKEHKQRGAYAPFGLGTHLCLGAGAAESQIVLVMASLLHMVNVERVQPELRLAIKNDPTPTLGYKFRVRMGERRHVIAASH